LYQRPTGPQIIGRVLDGGFELFNACLSKVFVLAGAASLVAAPINLVARYFARNAPGLAAFPVIVCGVLGIGLLVAAFNGAIIARIDSVARAAPLPMRDALSIGFRRLPITFLSGLVFTIGAALLLLPGLIVIASLLPFAPRVGPAAVLMFLVGATALLVPVSIYAVWLVFGLSAVIIERLGPIQSLSYSITIVRGHWWRTAVLLTMLGILFIALYALLGVVAGVIVALNPSVRVVGQLLWYFDVIVSPLVSTIAVPLMYSLLLSIYYDLRSRHDGGDLALRIAATA
jgi:hypothetical protein